MIGLMMVFVMIETIINIVTMMVGTVVVYTWTDAFVSSANAYVRDDTRNFVYIISRVLEILFSIL